MFQTIILHVDSFRYFCLNKTLIKLKVAKFTIALYMINMCQHIHDASQRVQFWRYTTPYNIVWTKASFATKIIDNLTSTWHIKCYLLPVGILIVS